MTPEEFQKKLARNARNIERLVNRTLPVKAGAIAQKHFRENFRKSGFVDDVLKPWKPSKRIGRAKGAAGRYGTLLSERKMLYNSIKRKTIPGAAIIYTSDQTQDYAAVHNEGLHSGRGKGFEMPQRRFIGDSATLDKEILQLIEDEAYKAFLGD